MSIQAIAVLIKIRFAVADLGGGCRRCAPPPPREMTCGFLIQLVFRKKKKILWFIGVEVEQETSAPPPKKIQDPPLFCICWFLIKLQNALINQIHFNSYGAGLITPGVGGGEGLIIRCNFLFIARWAYNWGAL